MIIRMISTKQRPPPICSVVEDLASRPACPQPTTVGAGLGEKIPKWENRGQGPEEEIRRFVENSEKFDKNIFFQNISELILVRFPADYLRENCFSIVI